MNVFSQPSADIVETMATHIAYQHVLAALSFLQNPLPNKQIAQFFPVLLIHAKGDHGLIRQTISTLLILPTVPQHYKSG